MSTIDKNEVNGFLDKFLNEYAQKHIKGKNLNSLTKEKRVLKELFAAGLFAEDMLGEPLTQPPEVSYNDFSIKGANKIDGRYANTLWLFQQYLQQLEEEEKPTFYEELKQISAPFMPRTHSTNIPVSQVKIKAKPVAEQTLDTKKDSAVAKPAAVGATPNAADLLINRIEALILDYRVAQNATHDAVTAPVEDAVATLVAVSEPAPADTVAPAQVIAAAAAPAPTVSAPVTSIETADISAESGTGTIMDEVGPLLDEMKNSPAAQENKVGTQEPTMEEVIEKVHKGQDKPTATANVLNPEGIAELVKNLAANAEAGDRITLTTADGTVKIAGGKIPAEGHPVNEAVKATSSTVDVSTAVAAGDAPEAQEVNDNVATQPDDVVDVTAPVKKDGVILAGIKGATQKLTAGAKKMAKYITPSKKSDETLEAESVDPAAMVINNNTRNNKVEPASSENVEVNPVAEEKVEPAEDSAVELADDIKDEPKNDEVPADAVEAEKETGNKIKHKSSKILSSVAAFGTSAFLSTTSRIAIATVLSGTALPAVGVALLAGVGAGVAVTVLKNYKAIGASIGEDWRQAKGVGKMGSLFTGLYKGVKGSMSRKQMAFNVVASALGVGAGIGIGVGIEEYGDQIADKASELWNQYGWASPETVAEQANKIAELEADAAADEIADAAAEAQIAEQAAKIVELEADAAADEIADAAAEAQIAEQAAKIAELEADAAADEIADAAAEAQIAEQAAKIAELEAAASEVVSNNVVSSQTVVGGDVTNVDNSQVINGGDTNVDIDNSQTVIGNDNVVTNGADTIVQGGDVVAANMNIDQTVVTDADVIVVAGMEPSIVQAVEIINPSNVLSAEGLLNGQAGDDINLVKSFIDVANDIGGVDSRLIQAVEAKLTDNVNFVMTADSIAAVAAYAKELGNGLTDGMLTKGEYSSALNKLFEQLSTADIVVSGDEAYDKAAKAAALSAQQAVSMKLAA